MNKVNDIQKVVNEYEGKINEANKKCDSVSDEYKQKINFIAERELSSGAKLTVRFGIKNPPFKGVTLEIIAENSSHRDCIYFSNNGGKALYEILKELYE